MQIFSAWTLAVVFAYWINEISHEITFDTLASMLKRSDPLPAQKVLTRSNPIVLVNFGCQISIRDIKQARSRCFSDLIWRYLEFTRLAMARQHTSTCSHLIHSFRTKVHNTARGLSWTSSQLPLTKYLQKPSKQHGRPQDHQALFDEAAGHGWQALWPLKQALAYHSFWSFLLKDRVDSRIQRKLSQNPWIEKWCLKMMCGGCLVWQVDFLQSQTASEMNCWNLLTFSFTQVSAENKKPKKVLTFKPPFSCSQGKSTSIIQYLVLEVGELPFKLPTTQSQTDHPYSHRQIGSIFLRILSTRLLSFEYSRFTKQNPAKSTEQFVVLESPDSLPCPLPTTY